MQDLNISVLDSEHLTEYHYLLFGGVNSSLQQILNECILSLNSIAGTETIPENKRDTIPTSWTFHPSEKKR